MKELLIILLVLIILFILFFTSCTKLIEDKSEESQSLWILWIERYLFPFLYVLLGGLLGFLGTLWNQIILQIKRKGLFKKRLHIDLKFILPVLIATYYSLNTSLGNFSKEALQWTYSMGVKHSVFKEDTLNRMHTLLEKANKKFYREAAEYYRDNEIIGKTIKKISIPVLETDKTILSLFKEKFQLGVLSIFRDIQVINEEVDVYYFNFKMTFEPNISKENFEKVNTNMDIGYKNIALLSKKLAESISSLIDEYYKKFRC